MGGDTFFAMKKKVATKFFYITGPDGSGKTTHADLLARELSHRGYRVRHVWLRFPFFFSLPLLIYARILGYSWHERYGDVWHGYWEFQRSWLMRRVFPYVYLLDGALASLLHVRVPILFGKTVLCERYVLDMLADMMVAIRDPDLPQKRIGRWFFSVIPERGMIIVLDAEPAAIRHRRKDLVSDRHFGERVAAFRHIAERWDLAVISTNRSIEVVREELLERVFSDV